MVFAYIGVLPLYFGWDEFRVAMGITDKEVLLKVFLGNSLAILFIPVGIYFSTMVFGYSMETYDYRGLDSKEGMFLFFLFLVSSFVLFLYIAKVPQLALVVAITEGAAESKVARSLMGNDFSGSYHWYSLFMKHLLTLSTYAFFANYLISKTIKSKLIFIVAFVLASLSALISAEKAPFIWLLIGLFLVYSLVRKNGSYGTGKILLISAIMVGFLVVFYTIFMGVEDINVAVLSVFSRAFTGGIAPAYYYFEFIPTHQDFLLGRTFPNPGGLLPFEPYRLTVEVVNWKFPSVVEKGIVGTAPTVFWAEMYANFSWFGVLISPFIVGFLLHLLYLKFNTLENTPIKAGLIIWLAMHYMHLSDTSLSGFIVDIVFIFVTIFTIGIIAVSNNFRIKYFS